MKFLVTGAAGFIGHHVSERLIAHGEEVIGLDNLNEYYDVNLKNSRLGRLAGKPNFRFKKLDLVDKDSIGKLFREERFDNVIHLAAQAGVRYSLTNPYAYTSSNIEGFLTVLEGCRNHRVQHLLFASSSSVYGANTKIPFSVRDKVDHLMSLYAATKRANELMAYTYSHTYALPCTGLRFFTVYGPWGRPDMALFLFTKAIIEGRPIDVFNFGRMQRDFTYIDDVVEGVVRVVRTVPKPDLASSSTLYRLYNIGNGKPVELTKFIEVLEGCLGKKAKKNLLPLQLGDVPVTYADVDDLIKDVGFRPLTSIEEGIKRFTEWYMSYYRNV